MALHQYAFFHNAQRFLPGHTISCRYLQGEKPHFDKISFSLVFGWRMVQKIPIVSITRAAIFTLSGSVASSSINVPDRIGLSISAFTANRIACGLNVSIWNFSSYGLSRARYFPRSEYNGVSIRISSSDYVFVYG